MLPRISRGTAERLAARRLRPLRTALEPVMPESRPRVAAVIPTLNEQEAIAGVVAAIPLDVVDRVIVVDSGSSEATVARASAVGAGVISEKRRGYGRACRVGAEE